MVGGRIINVITEGQERKWIQVLDSTYSEDTCAIWVKTTEAIKVGDQIWWQGRYAFWTPKPDWEEKRQDVPLERIGYSHSSIPAEVMEKMI